jgi:hypothetical protein
MQHHKLLQLFSKEKKETPKLKADACKMHQKPKLINSSKEYEEEEEEDSDFTFDNSQKSTATPIFKKIPVVENVKKKIPSSDSEEENDLFICKVPEVCKLLDEKKFNQKKVTNDCLMMNYWCRRTIKYASEEDTFLSIEAKKVLEKIEPNREKGKPFTKFLRGYGMTLCLKA